MVDDDNEQKEQIVSLKHQVKKALDVDGKNISAEEYAESSVAWDAAKASLQEEIGWIRHAIYTMV